MLTMRTLATARVSAILLTLFMFGCVSKNVVNPRLDDEMPKKILWAWERPEDLRFIDTNEYGVAFLAQTIFLENDRVILKPRRQPLELAPKTYLIAVTRIETNKDGGKRPTFDDEMVTKTASLIRNTLELPEVRSIQVDFDAVVSERAFYRKLMFELRSQLDKNSDAPLLGTAESTGTSSVPERGVDAPTPVVGADGVVRSSPGGNASVNERATTPTYGTLPDGRVSARSVRVPLTMTSLASWCTGDAWFNDFPVDEAVPMVFQMGADSDKVKTYLRNGNDWQEPLCRGSYGISINEPNIDGLKRGRRIYFFKDSSWKNDAEARTK